MPAGPSKNRSLSKRESKELNMMPVMNLFLVIIPMLMMLWGGTQLAFLYIDVSGGSGASTQTDQKNDKKEEKAEIKVGIFNNLIQIQVGGDKPIKIAALDSLSAKVAYNYPEFNKKLADLKKNDKRLVEVEDVKVYPAPDVRYEALLKTIDICKANNFPNIAYTVVKPSFAKVKRRK